jgi:Fic family protein
VVVVRKKVVDGREYFYLQHTVRTSTGVQTREMYLGGKLPPNVEVAKRDFLTEIYRERWYPLLDQVRSNYQKEMCTLPPSAIQKRDRSFSVKFTYDTSRIEGSKLTYRETADLLERGLSPRQKPIEDIKEAQAHDRVFLEALEYEKDLSYQVVLMWHKRLFKETKPDIAGKVRNHQVAISGSRFMPPSPVEVQPLLREFFRWYDRNKSSMHPVELAAGVHLRFVTVHPFADGNGRMSRLLMNFVLHRHGFPPLNIPYEGRRSYYNALERSQVKGNDSTFIQWFFRKYLKYHSAHVRAKK